MASKFGQVDDRAKKCPSPKKRLNSNVLFCAHIRGIRHRPVGVYRKWWVERQTSTERSVDPRVRNVCFFNQSNNHFLIRLQVAKRAWNEKRKEPDAQTSAALHTLRIFPISKVLTSASLPQPTTTSLYLFSPLEKQRPPPHRGAPVFLFGVSLEQLNGTQTHIEPRCRAPQIKSFPVCLPPRRQRLIAIERTVLYRAEKYGHRATLPFSPTYLAQI